MLWNYGAILLIVGLSSLIMKKKNWKNLLGASVVGSILFFLVSNFGSWVGNPMYTNDLAGLITCYAAGLPFYPNTLASTVLYAGVGYAVIEYGPVFIYLISHCLSYILSFVADIIYSFKYINLILMILLLLI